ncbi:MAG: hypothetical protein KAU62_07460 [Candidatus Heimdallarchaeota archaeon]|nr:hypothetical protein [Candidatus Heimdallarchaeota archaeon]MCG3255906.1 hypothetical protein [Candidatus Heimdallarchaeota archaeon]MCK4610977.1 hypothetical protein [Candidatus Heimdallarchaeota archaeon]
MRKISLFIVTLMVTSLFLLSFNNSISVTALENEDDDWDFTGTMRISSDQVRGLVFDPVAHGYNASYGDYDTPLLYMDIMGYDTDADEEMDIYYGFYGVTSLLDLTHINYTTMRDLLVVKVFAQWSFRIPESSPLSWEVLYYPDPFYDSIYGLIHKIPIYYVNLTQAEGVNLQFKIELGLNYTIGNFTTFGASNPLVPSMPTFPGYNVSVPVFTANLPIRELVETPFFSDPLTYVTIVTMFFFLGYYVKKRGKRTG